MNDSIQDEKVKTAEEIQVIDRDLPVPHGWPCSSCAVPIELHDQFCPSCGTPAKPPTAAQRTPTQVDETRKSFHCRNCGANVLTDPNQRSFNCPFCDSTYVSEGIAAASGRQRPEFVIGFAVSAEDAQQKFRDWISRNAWFRPGDLSLKALLDKQKGVYLPFWSFSMLALSDWSARIGEYWWRTETYTTTDSKGKTVTRTRQVQETEWWPLAGRHERYYWGYLVSGSRGLAQDDADRIKPFDLPALKRFKPYFLAGWLCEEYSVDAQEALPTCQQEFAQRERHNVAAFLPGDTYHDLQVNTTFTHINSDLCLLPVYVLSYRYQDKVFRFLVNGQTGRVAGDKPVSVRRISVAVVVTVLLILAIVAVIVVLQGR